MSSDPLSAPPRPGRRVWHDPEFARGARDMTAISLGIAAWGLVTGVAMIKSGLGLGLSVLMSLIVFAGTAQLAALPLIASAAPIWLVWATALCLNLRFIILSSQWRHYFGTLPRRQRLTMGYFCADLNFVAFTQRYPDLRPEPGQVPYFWGGVTVNWLAWQSASLLGIVLADRVPTHWGIGFAGTIALLGFTYSLLSDRRTWVAAVVSGTAAVATYALPLKLNIVVAIAAAVAIGVVMEHARPRARLAP